MFCTAGFPVLRGDYLAIIDILGHFPFRSQRPCRGNSVSTVDFKRKSSLFQLQCQGTPGPIRDSIRVVNERQVCVICRGLPRILRHFEPWDPRRLLLRAQPCETRHNHNVERTTMRLVGTLIVLSLSPIGRGRPRAHSVQSSSADFSEVWHQLAPAL